METPFLFSTLSKDDEAALDAIVPEVVPEVTGKNSSLPKKLGFWGGVWTAIKQLWNGKDYLSLTRNDEKEVTGFNPSKQASTHLRWFGTAFFGTSTLAFITKAHIALAEKAFILFASMIGGIYLSFVLMAIAFMIVALTYISIEVAGIDTGDEWDVAVRWTSLILSLTVLGVAIIAFHTVGIGYAILIALSPLVGFAKMSRIYQKKAKEDYEKIRSQHADKPMPTTQEVRRRFLVRADQEVKKARMDIEGRDSVVERRIATLKQKSERARSIARHFEDRLKGLPGDERLLRLYNEAQETARLFEEDRSALEHEQRVVLDLFQEVEAFIPAQEATLRDDTLEEELRMLQGQAVESRAMSKQMISDAVRPVALRLLPLEQARAHLLLRLAANTEPGSLAQLENDAGRVGIEYAETEQKLSKVVGSIGS